MKILLSVCLFACLVTMGSSLQCESCEGLGDTCKGPLQTCSDNTDKCGIFLMEHIVGVKAKAIKKSCVPSVSCREDTGVLNMGKAGMVVNHLFCCVGDKCNRINHVLKMLSCIENRWLLLCSTSQNDRVTTLGRLVVQELLQKQCSEHVGHFFSEKKQHGKALATPFTSKGEAVITTTMEGCTNRHMCTELQDHSASFSGINIVLSSTCKPAQSKAMMRVPWIARIISGQCSLFFQILTGLLLMFLVL